MTRRAKHALLNIAHGGSSLIIDGEEFPWDIAAEDIVVTQMEGLSLVRVSILVESTTVSANLSTMVEEKQPPQWGVPGDYLILQEDTPIPTNRVNVLKAEVEDLSLPYLVRTGKDLNAWVWSISPDPNGREDEAFSWEEVARSWRGDKLTVIS